MPHHGDIHPDYGYPREFVTMLARDETVREGIASHDRNWGLLGPVVPMEHALGHFFPGLAGFAPYQNSMEIEMYVIAIQRMLENPGREYGMGERAHFIADVERNHDTFRGRVTRDRTLYRCIQDEKGYSRDEMAKHGFHSAQGIAARGVDLGVYGITLSPPTVNAAPRDEWEITHDGAVYRYHAQRSELTRLPQGDSFDPFDTPPPETIGGFYNAVRGPLHKAMRIRAAEATGGRCLADAKLRELAVEIEGLKLPPIIARGRETVRPEAAIIVPPASPEVPLPQEKGPWLDRLLGGVTQRWR